MRRLDEFLSSMHYSHNLIILKQNLNEVEEG